MFEKLLKVLAQSLDKYHIPYMIIGGQAVLLYGEPRLTKNIDITLGVGPDRLKDLLSLVNEVELKLLVKKIEKFVKDTMVLPTQDPNTGIRVDFIFSYTPYERQAISQAKNVKINDRIVKFATPEDVIIHKIFSGRAIDIEDVKSIWIKNPNLDTQYIQKWLKEFDKTTDKNLLQRFKDIKGK